MLESVKSSLRNKATRCVEDGTAGIYPEITNLNHMISQLSQSINSLEQKIFNLSCRPASIDYISSEYILDSVRSLASQKPRLLICGYYGARNLGDELMLQAILKRLDSKKFDITIMLANHLEVDASIYAPHNVIHYPQRNDDILILAQNYDAIIWGGGAVIDDRWYSFKYLDNSLGYILLKTSIAALKHGKKVYVLGTSTNETIEDSIFIKNLQEIIQGANFFSLRDTNSLSSLQKAGIQTSSVKIINDLVIADLPNITPKRPSNTISVGMVFIFDDNIEPKIHDFIKLTTSYFKDKTLSIRCIPFFDHNNHDQKYFAEVVRRIKSTPNVNFIIEDFPDSIDKVAQVFSKCDLILSMRYHATLISSLYGIRTLSINFGEEHRHYHNKLSYIKDHYNDFTTIPFSKITDKGSVYAALDQALSQKTASLNSQLISASDAELSKIIKDINSYFKTSSKKQ